jgi:hypothetical protein
MCPLIHVSRHPLAGFVAPAEFELRVCVAFLGGQPTVARRFLDALPHPPPSAGLVAPAEFELSAGISLRGVERLVARHLFEILRHPIAVVVAHPQVVLRVDSSLVINIYFLFCRTNSVRDLIFV